MSDETDNQNDGTRQEKRPPRDRQMKRPVRDRQEGNDDD